MRAPVELAGTTVTQGLHGSAPSIDLASANPAVFAPEAGRVQIFNEAGGCGWGVHLTGERATHVLCHLAGRPLVPSGTRVEEGTLLAVQGSTGHSTGPHVHWQINKGDWRAIWREVGLGAYVDAGRGDSEPAAGSLWPLLAAAALGLLGALA